MRPCPEGGNFDVLGPTLYTRFLIAFKIIIHICFHKHILSAWTSLRDWRIFFYNKKCPFLRYVQLRFCACVLLESTLCPSDVHPIQPVSVSCSIETIHPSGCRFAILASLMQVDETFGSNQFGSGMKGAKPLHPAKRVAQL